MNDPNDPHWGPDINTHFIKRIRWMILLVMGISLTTSLGLIGFVIWVIIKLMQHFSVI